MNNEVAAALEVTESRIAWVLDHPRTSTWLKEALRGALQQNPIVVSNDVEVLSNLLRWRADAWVQDQLGAIVAKTGEWG